MRTTIDIDAPILREIRALQREQGRYMGRIVTDLLADALARRAGPTATQELRWTSRPMRALVDLADKAAVVRKGRAGSSRRGRTRGRPEPGPSRLIRRQSLGLRHHARRSDAASRQRCGLIRA